MRLSAAWKHYQRQNNKQLRNSYPGKNCVVTGHDNCKVEKWSAADEANATDKWIGFLRHLPEQTRKVQAEADSSDTSGTGDHAKYQTNAATQQTGKTTRANGLRLADHIHTPF